MGLSFRSTYYRVLFLSTNGKFSSSVLFTRSCSLPSGIHRYCVRIANFSDMADRDESPGTLEVGGDVLGHVRTRHEHFDAQAEILDDGRVNVHFKDRAFKLSKYLEERAKHTRGKAPLGEDLTVHNKKYDEHRAVLGRYVGIPRINIAIHIVGSRGDVQPFIAIAKELIKENHRVRICTHPVFKDFVEENGIEFFSIGGDPAVLMAYMVKNPGLMPGMESLRAGDVGKRRNDIAEILEGCWRGCIEPGDGMGKKIEAAELLEMDTDKFFIADAIIANPPSYGHIHCAEKLGIPLHMMFTMPWSPTQHFPHPLASLERNESDPHFANYISYTMMELLAWQGLGDVINGFRVKTLNLDPISPLWGHMLLSRMKVPFTYAWSSTLIPKPPDWGSHINISGFSFLSQASLYTPPDDLLAFLKAGPPPVYIGFGSIVVDDPENLTKMIFGAVKRAGVRALVSKGWGGLGGEHPPDGIFLLGNVPHDWLFQYVSAVVHHGGAGTTAIGIAMGKPTVVVPFFGDQPFWGVMIYRAGAGPEPVPFKKMTEESLAHSITKALEPEVQTAVREMSERISKENGAADAATSFHASINMDTMRCLLCPDSVAVWRIRKTNIRLSSLAAAVLLDAQIIRLSNLKLIRHRDWYVDEGAGDPIMGAVAAASGTMTNAITLLVDYTRSMSRSLAKPAAKAEGKTISDTSTVNEDLPDPPPLGPSESLDIIPSRNPVQRAATYSAAHLDRIAHQMASDSLPNRTSKSKSKRTYSWSPVQHATTLFHISTNESFIPPNALPHEHGRIHNVGRDTGHFAYEMAALGLKLPVAFFYNLANGLHNAPSFLLNDATVRRRPNITGFGSGVKVAGKEFTFGIFDGVTGLVYQPYLGAKKGYHSVSMGSNSVEGGGLVGRGVTGFGKGVGKGVGGLVCKTGAAAIGLPGYTLKGLERQLEKRHSRGLKAGLLMVRLRQGIVAFGRATEEQKEEIRKRWREGGFVV